MRRANLSSIARETRGKLSMKFALPSLLGLVLCQSAWAHVSLESPRAEAGGTYRAVFRVNHGCDNAATTAVAVQVPPALTSSRAEPRPGWNVTTAGATVTWTAKSEGLGA